MTALTSGNSSPITAQLAANGNQLRVTSPRLTTWPLGAGCVLLGASLVDAASVLTEATLPLRGLLTGQLRPKLGELDLNQLAQGEHAGALPFGDATRVVDLTAQ